MDSRRSHFLGEPFGMFGWGLGTFEAGSWGEVAQWISLGA